MAKKKPTHPPPEDQPGRKELLEQLQRTQAEFENYRKRIERDQDATRKRATERLIQDLCPILDTFGMALSHAKDEKGHIRGEELLQGLLMTKDQLIAILKDNGLEEIPTKGRFDPAIHEAIITVEDKDKENNTIIETFSKGYTLSGKLIKPARVSVVKNT